MKKLIAVLLIFSLIFAASCAVFEESEPILTIHIVTDEPMQDFGYYTETRSGGCARADGEPDDTGDLYFDESDLEGLDLGDIVVGLTATTAEGKTRYLGTFHFTPGEYTVAVKGEEVTVQ